MSDTGATPAQIEAAAKRMEAKYAFITDQKERHTLRYYGQFLVPPGARIVEPEDVVAVRLAHALAVAAHEWREAEADERGGIMADQRKTAAVCDLIDAIDALTPEQIDRLGALIGGGS